MPAYFFSQPVLICHRAGIEDGPSFLIKVQTPHIVPARKLPVPPGLEGASKSHSLFDFIYFIIHIYFSKQDGRNGY